MNTIFKIVLLAFFMATAVVSFAAKEHKKTLTESYDISNGATVELLNKYGNMDIRTIDSDQVNIRVEILVDAPNESKAQEVFERIDIQFYNSPNSVKAQTKIDAGKKGIWKSLTSWNSGDHFEIHYYVEVPTHVHLMLNNKYGNIFSENMDNDMDVVLKYGNLDMGDAHEVDLNIGYGNVKMNDVHDLEVDIKYGNLEAHTAYNVDLLSKYSVVKIDKAKLIDVESKYDKFTIKQAEAFENEGKYDNIKLGKIAEVSIESKYTDIDINELIKSAHIRTSYGGIRIDEITAELEEIDIISGYAGIRIGNPNEVGFAFDIETKYGSINIDEGTGEFGDDDNEEWARGKRKGKGGGRILIESKYGSVKIR